MAEWGVAGYTAVRALGSGGFGEVLLARHDATGTLVAIKYLRAGLLADEGFAAMFRAEAAVLASLDDPHVVRLFEYAEAPAGAAIVMELVDGVSLRQILDRAGGTTPEAALVVLEGSLLGLAAAHRRGVVHRDYKPENVLVSGDGASKLTDFGIAARAGDQPIPAGTLRYAAPEQMAGDPASPASDVYSATATFYECLTGHPPFTGDAVQLMYQHSAEPVPLEPVPEPLRPVVAAGMAKDPGGRPSDAASFVTGLQAVAGRAYGPDWARRGRSHLGEAALLLAALWPSAAAPAAQSAATTYRLSLLRRIRHTSPVKAAIAAGIAAGVIAAGIAIATALTHHPPASRHPAVLHKASPSPSRSRQRASGVAAHRVRIDPASAPLSLATPAYRPSNVELAGDGTYGLDNMTWHVWSGTQAVGTGIARLDDCNPSCAGGKQYYVKVKAVFSHPVRDCTRGRAPGAIRYWWSRADLTYPAGLPSVFSGANKPYGLWIFSDVIVWAKQSCAVPASPSPSAVAQSWNASDLIITSHSLGAVRIGMTIQQASAAAGEHLIPVGDGAYYPAGGTARGLSVAGSSAGTVSCVSAANRGGTPTVTTPQGFALGGTLTQLKAVYGNRLRFVPAPAGGINPVPGYVVAFADGNLAFWVTNGKVAQIVGGPGILPSASCA